MRARAKQTVVAAADRRFLLWLLAGLVAAALGSGTVAMILAMTVFYLEG
jgi:H+/gluconate symporter-like permease